MFFREMCVVVGVSSWLDTEPSSLPSTLPFSSLLNSLCLPSEDKRLSLPLVRILAAPPTLGSVMDVGFVLDDGQTMLEDNWA